MVYLGRSIGREMYFGAKPDLFRIALSMRNNPTEAEKVLWKHLKKFRSEEFIFSRQHPIDIFIADFYCHKLKLIIEVDGEIHFNDQPPPLSRERWTGGGEAKILPYLLHQQNIHQFVRSYFFHYIACINNCDKTRFFRNYHYESVGMF